jgi:hypothetical protein
MTNPSETSALVERLRGRAGWYDDAHPGTVKTPELLREAADTIDRLTSTGEAVACPEGLPCERLTNMARKHSEEAAIVSRIWEQFGNPSYAELAGRSIYDLIDELKVKAAPASPREGHVEVPDGMVLVPREADGAMATAAYKDQPGAINWSATQAWRTMVRAALPHNQGETKPAGDGSERDLDWNEEIGA